MAYDETRARATARVVDAWIQHPNARLASDPAFESLRRWTGTSLEGAMPIDFTISAMDAANVGRALLSAWWGPGGAMISNDEVATHVRAHPDRFVGIGSLDLWRPMDAVRELRRCVKQLGFRGVRMLPWLWRLPPNDRRYYPIYAECIELGVPFCLQVGHTGPLAPSEPGRPIPYLDEVALDFPELVIVGGHVGYPWTLEMISLARKYPNVWIDTSAYKPSRYPPELVDYLRTSESKKVLFGSNYPMLMPGACLAEIPALGLSEKALARFLHENAETVFGLAKEG